MMHLEGLASLLAGFAVLMSCGSGHSEAAHKDIVDTAVGAGSFKTLVAAVQAAGLEDTLRGDGPFTVFAPSDEAFAKLPAGTVENLLKPQNLDQLRAILSYHVVPGRLMASDVAGKNSVSTVFGQPAPIQTSGSAVQIGGARIVQTDILTSNGVIHVIDTVIMPAGIIEVAAQNGSFNTLIAAVKAAGLSDTLSGPGPFTVFAPTDEAFAKLPAGTVENLLKPENRDQLVSILTYHVVSGRVLAADAVKLSSAPTVNGKAAPISVTDGKVMVGGAEVVATDIVALNGVIHVVDSVMLP